jgi:adenine/guanine phosphoribosyltransferase-like PRPP-binding protein
MNSRGVTLRVKSEKPIEHWCSEETYNKIISTCLLDGPEISVDGPSECRLSDELTEELKDKIQNDSESKATILVIDFTSFDQYEERYHKSCDWLCASLHLRLSDSADKKPSTPVDIFIIVSGIDEFLNTVALKEILTKTCKENKVGLIIIQITPNTCVKIISKSDRLDSSCTRKKGQFDNFYSREEKQEIPVEDLIEQSIDLIYGHFEITSTDPFHSGRSKKAHVDTLVSLERCLKEDRVLFFLQDIIEKWAGDNNFICIPIGIQGGELESLVMGIVNNNYERFGTKINFNRSKVAIICDVLWDVYDLEVIAQSCKKQGAKDVFILSFAKYRYKDLQTVTNYSIVEVDGHEFVKPECPFCKNGVEVIGENYEYLEQYLKTINSFSAYVFWEMVSSTPDAFKEGHWKSPITQYHYLHRFWCEPLFKKHGYGIALRLKNKILDKGIFSEWIDALICPDEASAVMLAENICRVFLLSTERIIKIEREYLNKVTGTSIPVELEEDMKEIKGKNIVLIDQAAHHFGTVHALKFICEQLGVRILAFTVFVDRLQPNNSVKESLPTSHYISLYNWPWPPYKADHCPCNSKPH